MRFIFLSFRAFFLSRRHEQLQSTRWPTSGGRRQRCMLPVRGWCRTGAATWEQTDKGGYQLQKQPMIGWQPSSNLAFPFQHLINAVRNSALDRAFLGSRGWLEHPSAPSLVGVHFLHRYNNDCGFARPRSARNAHERRTLPTGPSV